MKNRPVALLTPTFVSSQLAHRLLLLAGLLVGFGLRLYRLGAESLWYDETVSVFLASKNISALLAHTAGDIHPPGYYLLLHAWRTISRPTVAYGLEFLYAWPSLCFGLLILSLLYLLARRLVDGRVALLTLWLAALNPFHVWYSQEVRMYTLGAALGLLCLWAFIQQMSHRGRYAWLLYLLAAAAGLYTLYYFAFLLLTLNVLALLFYFTPISSYVVPARLQNRTSLPSLLTWLAIQLGVLLLWLPWLPIFWRQAIEPPVPPWRSAPASLSAFLRDVNESVGVLLAGQSAPLAWLWGGVVVLVLVLAWHNWGHRQNAQHGWSQATTVGLLALYTLLPITLLHLLTVTVTPLYFVRYVFTYAPPVMILLAMAVLGGRNVRLPVVAARLAGISLLFGVSLHAFWTDPSYRADDHRRAVADLAASWRPGDAILVNAGWAYTALMVYWPTEIADVDGAAPPPLANVARLTELLPSSTVAAHLAPERAGPYFERRPLIWRTGSIGGSPNLGWGSPESDFFAMSKSDAVVSMAALSQRSARIWHYRLYDTVNDPNGLMRSLLEQTGNLRWEMAYPGRDFLRVQLYTRAHEQHAGLSGIGPLVVDAVNFGDALRLVGYRIPETRAAGEMLYADIFWRALPGLTQLPSTVSMSLRLYNDNGVQVAQQDEAPLVPTRAWAANEMARQPLALPVPVSLPPGLYQLRLLAYTQADAIPLSLAGAEPGAASQGWQLGTVRVLLPIRLPSISTVLARFDYIDLVHASVTPSSLVAGQSATLELIWRPRPNSYRDTYTAIIELRDSGDAVIAEWSAPVGGTVYPSGDWPPSIPVREVHSVVLPADLASGAYTIALRLVRASDGLPIAARTSWLSDNESLDLTGFVVSD